MLLIDNIREDVQLPNVLKSEPYDRLVENLNTAMIFNVGDDVRDGALQIVDSKPTSLLHALRYCLLPFDPVWIEFNHQKGFRVGLLLHGPSYATSSAVQPMELTDESIAGLKYNDERFEYTSNASLIADDFSGEGVCTVFFNEKIDPEQPWLGERVNFYGDTIRFCFREDLEDRRLFMTGSPDVMAGYKSFMDDSEFVDEFKMKYYDKWEVEFLADEQFRNCFCFEDAEEYLEEWRMEKFEDDYIPTGHGQNIEFGGGVDVEKILVGLLLMLNTPRVVEYRDSNLHRLNRRRMQRGKLPLYEHQIVSLKIGRPEVHTHGQSGTGTASSQRATLVRGHFKLRETGVFWWKPYLRGNPELGFIDRDYDVSKYEGDNVISWDDV